MLNGRSDWDYPGLHNFRLPEEVVSGLHNFRPPVETVPGLHNFRQPEETAPGFRMSADGSMHQASTSGTRLVPGVIGSSVGLADDADPAALPASDGRPSACPLVGRVGPNCVYQCSPREWIYYPAPYAGSCLPFAVPGHGTRLWGGR